MFPQIFRRCCIFPIPVPCLTILSILCDSCNTKFVAVKYIMPTPLHNCQIQILVPSRAVCFTYMQSVLLK